MADYYIKTIDGPEGQKGYPYKGLIHFAKDEERYCEQFKKCSGFLIYETVGKKRNGKGAKAVFAYGVIDSNQPSYIVPIESNGKIFPYAVKVKLQKIVDPKNGIPFKKFYEITNIRVLLSHGGIKEINKEHFKTLCGELDKRA